MPTYDYRCENCGNEIEVFQSIKDAPLTKCPKCGKDTLKKMISGGAGLIFKGTGFYLTDYKDKKTSNTGTTSTPKKSEPTATASKDSEGK